ncbi:unnamed protein product [Rotaria socialis]|uniref:UDENN domain-containing protein n=1 Tax=Rotaria socialis TaxID=392032 RepID=A0A820K3A9_9BILA|nr:unnamed protein product [Rotaria socialis]CAF3322049.1 unnamed protein product [Rotaria socialis]CAF4330858.1 unnamed protein product [Rotaria socialis]CAF4666261.1 unnamed protein product [Rotaria socialis]
MLNEENLSCEKSFVVHLIIIGFHHKKGHQIEYSYPLLNEPIDERWSNIGGLALPDGAHNRNKDLIYFHVPSIEQDQYSNKTLFGIASYRQIDANTVINKEADVTRNSIQKSVCLILRKPVYGNISEELEMLTEKYFQEKNFNERKPFEDFVDKLNKNPPEFDLKYYSARDLVIRYRRRTLILFKLILLQKKVLFILSPIQNLVQTIMNLVSLIPGIIETGLNECTFIDDKNYIENNFELNENEDIVFDRNINKQLDFDNIKLKTLKISDNNEPEEEDEDDDDDDEEDEIKNNKINLLKRATSITNKLTDTFNRLTTNNSVSIEINNEENFASFDQCQFSYELFKKNNLLYPYLSIHSLDIINNKNVNSYIIGASNGLFRQQNNLDFILIDNDEDFQILSSELKQQLQLTTADLRFTQLFEDSQSNVKTEEEIRRLFKIYFLSLLSVARTPNDQGINDFNSSFMKSFQSTNAFHLWQSKGPYPHMDQIPARHPQSGQLNVTDVKLRVAHALDDTETGRKLKNALEDTSQFMGDKSRAASKVLGQAKNSIFSSLVGTINQGKQWLAKNPSSS